VYLNHEGVNHEVVGIAPHIRIPVFSLHDLEAGRNTALEITLDAITVE
jgi:hypothetical protein